MREGLCHGVCVCDRGRRSVSEAEKNERRETDRGEREGIISATGRAAILLAGFIPNVHDVITLSGGGGASNGLYGARGRVTVCD